MLFETTNYTSFIHFRPLGDKMIAKKTPYMTVNVNKKANALFIIYALRLLLRLLFLLYLWRFYFFSLAAILPRYKPTKKSPLPKTPQRI